MKAFECKDIKEVWDFRLSSACPLIDRSSGTWVVKIFSKSNPDHTEGAAPIEPLEIHDTGIKTEPNDIWDEDKIRACFEWLYSVRDNYSLENIEELKPHVKKINDANKALAELGAV